MKKTKIIAAILLCGIVIALVSGKREPRYDGKTYSDWFRQFYSSLYQGDFDAANRDEAFYALHKMGTKVYPLLVREYFSEQKATSFSKWNYKIKHWLISGKREVPPYIYPEHVHHDAGQAILRLRPSAQTLIPLLSDALGPDTNNYQSALYLMRSIDEGREQAVPFLVAALNHPNARTRTIALQSLVELGEAADAALPDLLKVFEESQRIDPYVTALLGNTGSRAKAAVPKLERICASTNGWRPYAAVALYQIEPGNPFALKILTNMTESKPGGFENLAAALGQARRFPSEFIGPFITSTNEHIRILAVPALEKHSPQTAASVLRDLLKSHDANTQLMAAGRLLRNDRMNQPARNFLLNYLYEHKKYWRGHASGRNKIFQHLGEASSEAKDVVSALSLIGREERDEGLCRVAEKTLKRIKTRELMEMENR